MVDIPEQAVEAAAKAHTPQFDRMDETIKKYALEQMLAALTAAAPYMREQSREQALDLSVLERLAKIADDYDEPDENGPFPDIQDAMISIRDLRQIRQLLATIRALKSQPAPHMQGAVVKEYLTTRNLSSPDHADAGKVEWDTRPAPAATDTGLETVFTQWINGKEDKLVTRSQAEAIIAAKDARIAELERRLKEVELEHTGVRNSYFAERRKASVLEADNKRLREALETIADGNFLFPSELRFSARAALGEAKP